MAQLNRDPWKKNSKALSRQALSAIAQRLAALNVATKGQANWVEWYQRNPCGLYMSVSFVDHPSPARYERRQSESDEFFVELPSLTMRSFESELIGLAVVMALEVALSRAADLVPGLPATLPRTKREVKMEPEIEPSIRAEIVGEHLSVSVSK